MTVTDELDIKSTANRKTTTMALNLQGQTSPKTTNEQNADNDSTALFACTRCNARHLFDDLSPDMMLCKDCRDAYVMVKCTYCRSEFQQDSKSNLSSVCRKCDINVKKYGKPTSCEFCNIIAAFVGSKCQRCTHSEKKYGPPVQCDQCKQRSAFDRKNSDSQNKVDGKRLCWLCMLSYKRALAKASKRKDGSSRHSSHHHHHKRSRPDQTTANGHSNSLNGSNGSSSVSTNLTNDASAPDTSTSPSSGNDAMSANDSVVLLAQLREKSLALDKIIKAKAQEILKKDIRITELKSELSKEQRACREKIHEIQKNHNEHTQELQSKINGLAKQVATFSKSSKKPNGFNSENSPKNY